MPSIAKNLWRPSRGAWRDQDRTHFAVWAPRKNSIEVVLERRGHTSVHALEPGDRGYFRGVVPEAQPGDLYKYRLNGSDEFPDPASRFQPKGVHGPSQIIHPSAFSWTDQAWRGRPLSELVVYELHVGTFSPEGTYRGVTDRLPYLNQLGITAIELMPLADFPGERNWGYDGVSLFAPARCYGSPDDLRQLVDAAHAAGIAVLLDVVYNHLGPDGNYTGAFSPYYVTSRHQTVWGHALNLDGDHAEEVRSFLIENALHWLHEYHFDGLRLDATHALMDTSRTHLLAELSSQVSNLFEGRHVHLIAEDNRNNRSLVTAREAGGMGLTAVWSDDFHHQVRRLTAGDKDGYYMDFSDAWSDVATTINQGWFYTGQQAPFFKTPRGTPTEGIDLQRFVFFIQNHDQIGNRAFGDRLNHQIDLPLYRAVSGLLLLAPETPLLFMGQEWAASTPFLYFTDHSKELGKLVTQGRKDEFKSFSQFNTQTDIPDPQSIVTFERSQLNWQEVQKEPYRSTLALYQALLAVRRKHVVDTVGKAHTLGDSTLALHYDGRPQESLTVIVHFGKGGTFEWKRPGMTEGKKRMSPAVEQRGPRFLS